ncbi:MAG: DUF2177 family protein [Oligoflexia bacterium]|nr:DUF2177 family protein [Oligoflexia bacterium]
MLRSFFTALFLFLVLDIIWLGYVIAPFNKKQLAEIGRFQNGEFDLYYLPAVGVYILMAIAVGHFVLPRIAKNDSHFAALKNGAVMGLIVYGVFDLTNLAILKNYPVEFLVVDVAWGVVSFSLVTLVSKLIRDRRPDLERTNPT